MEIIYKTTKLKRICTVYKDAEKKHGSKMAVKIHQRIEEIIRADSIDTMLKCRIGRCHALSNNRQWQYGMDLIHPYRLVFELDGDKIKILEIVDYH